MAIPPSLPAKERLPIGSCYALSRQAFRVMACFTAVALLAVAMIAYEIGFSAGVQSADAKRAKDAAQPLSVDLALPRSDNRDVGGRANPSGETSRRQWVNVSYDVTLRHLSGNEWAEFDNKTGQLRAKYEETGRSKDYVELFRPDRQQKHRILASRSELFKNGRWEWVSNGRWVDEHADVIQAQSDQKPARSDAKAARPDIKPAHAMTRAQFRQTLIRQATVNSGGAQSLQMTGPIFAATFGEPDKHQVVVLRIPGDDNESYEHLHWRCQDGCIEVVFASWDDECNKPLVDHNPAIAWTINAVNDEDATYAAVPQYEPVVVKKPATPESRRTAEQVRSADEFHVATSSGKNIDFKTEYSVDEIREAFSNGPVTQTPDDKFSATDKKPGSPYRLDCIFLHGHAVEMKLDYGHKSTLVNAAVSVDAGVIAEKLTERFGEPDAKPFDGRISWDFPSVSRHIYYWHYTNGIADSLTVTFSKSGWENEAETAKRHKERESVKNKDVGF